MSRRNRVFLFGFAAGAVTVILLRRPPLLAALPATPEQIKLIGENLNRTMVIVTPQGMFAGRMPV